MSDQCINEVDITYAMINHINNIHTWRLTAAATVPKQSFFAEASIRSVLSDRGVLALVAWRGPFPNDYQFWNQRRDESTILSWEGPHMADLASMCRMVLWILQQHRHLSLPEGWLTMEHGCLGKWTKDDVLYYTTLNLRLHCHAGSGDGLGHAEDAASGRRELPSIAIAIDRDTMQNATRSCSSGVSFSDMVGLLEAAEFDSSSIPYLMLQ